MLTNLGQPLYFTMTHEQFIELSTAELAKLAGFDWECSTFYTETFDYTDQDGTGKFEFRRDDNLRYRNPNDDRNSFVNNKGTLLEYKFKMYSAPTQSVLQRWLREVKKIIVEPMWHIRAQFYSCGIVMPEWQNLGDVTYTENGSTYKEGFNTYEAALEAGLKQCLTLLIEKE